MGWGSTNTKMATFFRAIISKMKREERENTIFMKGEFYSPNSIQDLPKYLRFN
jgi:hypothetical protein